MNEEQLMQFIDRIIRGSEGNALRLSNSMTELVGILKNAGVDPRLIRLAEETAVGESEILDLAKEPSTIKRRELEQALQARKRRHEDEDDRC